MRVTEAIERYLAALRIDRGASANTVEAYQRDLLQWRDWLESATSDLHTLGPDSVHRFLSHLHKQKIKGDQTIKASSVGRKASALRQFFKFCCLELGLEINPTEQLQTPKLPRKLPKALSHEAVATLLAAVDKGLPYPGRPSERGTPEHEKEVEALRARDRAIIYLMYASGLRVSETVGLTTHRLQLGDQGRRSRPETVLNYVRVLGKGNKERIVPFAPIAAEYLHEYMEKHRPYLLRPHTTEGRPRRPTAGDTVFVSAAGAPLTRQSCWLLMKSFAHEARLTDTLSPHVLRHSFATHLLHSGMNLRSLQTLLGHSDLSTTQIYAAVTPEHLQEAYRLAHPRSK